MRCSALPLCAAIAGLFAAAPLASASLSIANPSFELPAFADGAFGQQFITLPEQGGYGWTFSDASGIYNPPGNDYTGAGGIGTPAGGAGSQVAFSVQRYPLFQMLAGTDGVAGNADDPLLTPRTTYSLTLNIGQRLPGNQFGAIYGGYVLELIAGVGAGATVIAQEIDAITPGAGTFVPRTLTVDSTSLSPTLYGQPLTIRIASTVNAFNAVTDFDNVRLDANTTALWSNAIDGNWNDTTKWSTNPIFPNNGSGDGATYNAVINATGAPYNVTLGTNVALENFTLNSANATILHHAGALSVTGLATLAAGTHLVKGGSIIGGTINAAGGALVFGDSVPDGNRLAGVTINGDFVVQDTVSAFVRIGTGTTLNGVARLRAASGATIAFEGSQTLGSGTISFESGTTPSHVEMQSAGTLTIGPVAAIRGGEGRVGGSFYFGAAMTLANQGLISAEVNGRTLRLVPSAGLSNSGTMQAINGGVLSIEPAAPWTNTGMITVNSATLNLGGTFNVTGGIGTWSNTNGVVNVTGTINNTGRTLTLNNATGSWTLNGGTINGGTLAFADGRTLVFNGVDGNLLNALTVAGDLTLSAANARTKLASGTRFQTAHLSGSFASLGFAPGQTLNDTILFEGAATGVRAVEMNGNAGAFVIGTTGVVRTATDLSSDAQIGGTNFFGGAMTLTNQGTISSQTLGRTISIKAASFTNSGTLEAVSGGSLNIPGGYTQDAGVTRLSGTLTAQTGSVTDTIELNGGALEGHGNIVANVALSGVLDPTTGAGGLAISGDLGLGANAELRFTIGGAAPGTQYDFLSEAGAVPLTLDGTLVLALANGFVPAPTDTFTVLTSNAVLGGAFDNIAPGMRLVLTDGTSSFQVNYGAGSQSIVLSNFVPEPGSAALAFVGAALLGTRARREVRAAAARS